MIVTKKLLLLLTLCVCLTVQATDFSQCFTITSENNEKIVNPAVLNEIIGADAFYEKGIYGQNTRTAVVESGSAWFANNIFQNANLGEQYAGFGITEEYISPHMTAIAGLIGGVGPEVPVEERQDSEVVEYSPSYFGIAPKTQICTGSVGGESTVSMYAFVDTLRHYYEVEPADVISSSFSPILTPAEIFAHKDLLDGFASKYTKTTYVIAAGNDGPAANTVCHLGLSYNAITVGALGNPNNFNAAADFSSRGASNFYNPYTDETIEGVRATIDITAPGENILLANYVSTNPSNTDAAMIASGTSFAAPTVAAVASLLVSASKELEANLEAVAKGWSSRARDSRVIKAVLMNSADKPVDWDNGQTLVEGVTTTSQALDYTYGTGILNAKNALEQYTTSTNESAWVLNDIELGYYTQYELGTFDADKILTATLVWMVQNTYVVEDVSATETEEATMNVDITDAALANLNLELLVETADGLTAVALSNSQYNTVEHLNVKLQESGKYYLRVNFDEMIYGKTENNSETYALAWKLNVPEPADYAVACAMLALLFAIVMRAKKSSCKF